MKRIISLLLSVVLLVGFVTAGAVPVSAASDFVASDELVEMLKIMEGFDKYPRWDYMQWTVGYGTACPAEDLERYREYGITEEEADALLRLNLKSFGKSVNSFNDKYELNFTQNQFDAILLFTYNMGHAWMFREGSFRASLIDGVTGPDLLYEFGQWCHAGGEVLTYLVQRRIIEYNMFENNVYSRSVPDNYCYVLYEFNGGSGETDVQVYDCDLESEIRVIPTRDGYTFAGWYTSDVGGIMVTSLDASVDTMTLYARWIKGTDGSGEVEQPEEPETMDPVTVTVTASDVNVRQGPGTNYSVVDCLDKGAQLTITEIKTGTGYTWGKFDGGWIALMYTNYEQVMPQEPEEETTEPTEPEPTETEPTEPEPTETEPTEPEPTEPPVTEPEVTTVMGTVTGSDLHIRSGPGTSYAILGLLQKGDRVEILEQKTVGAMDWGKIEQGWICLSYVKLDEPVEEEPEEEPTEPETPTEPEEPEEPDEPAEPTDPEEEEPETMTGTVKVSDYLRIRSGPGTQYSMVGYLTNGARVEVLETRTVDGVEWGRIAKGWISLDYVVLDQTETEPEPEPAPEPETRIMTVTADCLHIRSGAGLNYTIVGFLYEGAKVEVLETKTVDGMEWARISKGWVSMDYLK